MKSLTSSMVKIALRKLFAGILCGCVVLLVLVAKWVRGKKPSKPIHILTALFTIRIHKENKQVLPYQPTSENFGQHNLLYVYLSACWKTGQKSCKNKHGENCVAQVVCWYFVRLCGAACWLRSERWKKNIQTYPYSNCTFHHQNSQRKQTNFTVPTNLIENFGQHNLLYVSLSAWKTEQNPCKNKHGENCIAQVVCWYFVRLCGAAGVGCEVSEGKKTIQIYPYSNCTFHHQNSQRKQTIFYHTNQPYWKLWPTQSTVCVSFSMENRRETMQEQTWWKLHCASCLLVFCAVVWCCWCWLRSEWGKKPSKPIHILTALFTTRVHKENKQVLPYQPTSGKLWPTQSIYCMCIFQHVGKQDRTHARTNMVKLALRKLFAGILCGCVVLLVGCEVSDEKKHPNLSIF